MVKVDNVPGRILFDTTGSYLYTEIGTINISTVLSVLSILTVIEPRSLIYQGLVLSPDRAWIIYNSENLV